MVRRKKRGRRRSPKTVSIWNIAEGYITLGFLTGAILGNTPMGFITGKSDITPLASIADGGLGYWGGLGR